ncbi:MAG: SDR family oxidoreductase [Acidobacteria bacterium]|nr:SDR family oxidoreductase [Acidobacteriota bacterium]
MDVVVTGGAGFIGSNLTEALLARGDRVRVLDNFLTGSPRNLEDMQQRFGQRLDVVRGDIRDLDTVRKVAEGAAVVYHQAALPSVAKSIHNPLDTNHININGTLNLFLAARDMGVSRVVFASSSSVYGDSPTLPKREEMPPRPLSPYALTKLVGEHYARIFCDLYGLEVVSLRYFNVFGPRQDPTSEYAAVIPRFVSRMLSGLSPVIYGDGEQTRDFTFVENAVQANLAAATVGREACGQVFNVACGEQISLNQLVRLLNRLLGSSVQPLHEAARVGDIKHSLADVGRARAILGYQGAVSFEEGLKRCIDWYRKRLS